MKKGLCILLCTFLLCVLAGCGTSAAEIDAYHQKLYAYYYLHLRDSETLGDSLQQFNDFCTQMDVNNIALKDVDEESKKGIMDGNEEIMAGAIKELDIVGEPPEECRKGYELAERVKDAYVGIFAARQAAFEYGQAGGAMSYAKEAVEEFGNYTDALLELGDYFKGIEFEPKS